MALIIKNFNKRLICLTLCICFLMPVFDSERYDSYAMDLVITPAVVALVVTGLVACGITFSTNKDANAVVGQVWQSMDYALKQSLLALSTFETAVKLGVSMWTTSVWNDFKSSVSSFFKKDGGLWVDTSSVGFSFPTKDTFFSEQFISGTSYKETFLSSYGNSMSYIVYGDRLVYYFYPIKNNFKDRVQVSFYWVTYNSVQKYATPYVSETRITLPGFSGVGFSDIYSFVQNGSTNDLVYKKTNTIVATGFPISADFNKTVYTYLTGAALPIPYAVDGLYYPVGTGSICPDVPKDKVMSLPLVNDVAIAVPADLVGKATFRDIPINFPIDTPIDPTIPVDPTVPVVPPVDPPVIDAKKIDWSPLMSANFSKVFPFCIPFDFVRLVKSYASAPKEPDFNININTKYLKIKYTINKDPIMLPVKFFRTFAIFAFILLLINKTRDMMKW